MKLGLRGLLSAPEKGLILNCTHFGWCTRLCGLWVQGHVVPGTGIRVLTSSLQVKRAPSACGNQHQHLGFAASWFQQTSPYTGYASSELASCAEHQAGQELSTISSSSDHSHKDGSPPGQQPQQHEHADIVRDEHQQSSANMACKQLATLHIADTAAASLALDALANIDAQQLAATTDPKVLALALLRVGAVLECLPGEQRLGLPQHTRGSQSPGQRAQQHQGLSIMQQQEGSHWGNNDSKDQQLTARSLQAPISTLYPSAPLRQEERINSAAWSASHAQLVSLLSAAVASATMQGKVPAKELAQLLLRLPLHSQPQHGSICLPVLRAAQHVLMHNPSSLEVQVSLALLRAMKEGGQAKLGLLDHVIRSHAQRHTSKDGPVKAHQPASILQALGDHLSDNIKAIAAQKRSVQNVMECFKHLGFMHTPLMSRLCDAVAEEIRTSCSLHGSHSTTTTSSRDQGSAVSSRVSKIDKDIDGGHVSSRHSHMGNNHSSNVSSPRSTNANAAYSLGDMAHVLSACSQLRFGHAGLLDAAAQAVQQQWNMHWLRGSARHPPPLKFLCILADAFSHLGYRDLQLFSLFSDTAAGWMESIYAQEGPHQLLRLGHALAHAGISDLRLARAFTKAANKALEDSQRSKGGSLQSNPGWLTRTAWVSAALHPQHATPGLKAAFQLGNRQEHALSLGVQDVTSHAKGYPGTMQHELQHQSQRSWSKPAGQSKAAGLQELMPKLAQAIVSLHHRLSLPQATALLQAHTLLQHSPAAASSVSTPAPASAPPPALLAAEPEGELLAGMVRRCAGIKLQELKQGLDGGAQLRPLNLAYSLGNSGYSLCNFGRSLGVGSFDGCGSSENSLYNSGRGSSRFRNRCCVSGGRRSSGSGIDSRASAHEGSRRLSDNRDGDLGSGTCSTGSKKTDGVDYIGPLDPAQWPQPVWALPLVSDFGHALVASGLAHSWPKLAQMTAELAADLMMCPSIHPSQRRGKKATPASSATGWVGNEIIVKHRSNTPILACPIEADQPILVYPPLRASCMSSLQQLGHTFCLLKARQGAPATQPASPPLPQLALSDTQPHTHDLGCPGKVSSSTDKGQSVSLGDSTALRMAQGLAHAAVSLFHTQHQHHQHHLHRHTRHQPRTQALHQQQHPVQIGSIPETDINTTASAPPLSTAAPLTQLLGFCQELGLPLQDEAAVALRHVAVLAGEPNQRMKTGLPASTSLLAAAVEQGVYDDKLVKAAQQRIALVTASAVQLKDHVSTNNGLPDGFTQACLRHAKELLDLGRCMVSLGPSAPAGLAQTLSLGLQAALPPVPVQASQHARLGSICLVPADQVRQVAEGMGLLAQLKQPRWTQAYGHAAVAWLDQVLLEHAGGREQVLSAKEQQGSGKGRGGKSRAPQTGRERMLGMEEEQHQQPGTRMQGQQQQQEQQQQHCSSGVDAVLAAEVARAMLAANCHWSGRTMRKLLRLLKPTPSPTGEPSKLPLDSHLCALAAILHLRTTSGHLRIHFYSEKLQRSVFEADLVLQRAGQQVMQLLPLLGQAIKAGVQGPVDPVNGQGGQTYPVLASPVTGGEAPASPTAGATGPIPQSHSPSQAAASLAASQPTSQTADAANCDNASLLHTGPTDTSALDASPSDTNSTDSPWLPPSLPLPTLLPLYQSLALLVHSLIDQVSSQSHTHTPHPPSQTYAKPTSYPVPSLEYPASALHPSLAAKTPTPSSHASLPSPLPASVPHPNNPDAAQSTVQALLMTTGQLCHILQNKLVHEQEVQPDAFRPGAIVAQDALAHPGLVRRWDHLASVILSSANQVARSVFIVEAASGKRGLESMAFKSPSFGSTSLLADLSVTTQHLIDLCTSMLQKCAKLDGKQSQVEGRSKARAPAAASSIPGIPSQAAASFRPSAQGPSIPAPHLFTGSPSSPLPDLSPPRSSDSSAAVEESACSLPGPHPAGNLTFHRPPPLDPSGVSGLHSAGAMHPASTDAADSSTQLSVRAFGTSTSAPSARAPQSRRKQGSKRGQLTKPRPPVPHAYLSDTPLPFHDAAQHADVARSLLRTYTALCSWSPSAAYTLSDSMRGARAAVACSLTEACSSAQRARVAATAVPSLHPAEFLTAIAAATAGMKAESSRTAGTGGYPIRPSPWFDSGWAPAVCQGGIQHAPMLPPGELLDLLFALQRLYSVGNVPLQAEAVMKVVDSQLAVQISKPPELQDRWEQQRRTRLQAKQQDVLHLQQHQQQQPLPEQRPELSCLQPHLMEQQPQQAPVAPAHSPLPVIESMADSCPLPGLDVTEMFEAAGAFIQLGWHSSKTVKALLAFQHQQQLGAPQHVMMQGLVQSKSQEQLQEQQDQQPLVPDCEREQQHLPLQQQLEERQGGNQEQQAHRSQQQQQQKQCELQARRHSSLDQLVCRLQRVGMVVSRNRLERWAELVLVALDYSRQQSEQQQHMEQHQPLKLARYYQPLQNVSWYGAFTDNMHHWLQARSAQQEQLTAPLSLPASLESHLLPKHHLTYVRGKRLVRVWRALYAMGWSNSAQADRLAKIMLHEIHFPWLRKTLPKPPVTTHFKVHDLPLDEAAESLAVFSDLAAVYSPGSAHLAFVHALLVRVLVDAHLLAPGTLQRVGNSVMVAAQALKDDPRESTLELEPGFKDTNSKADSRSDITTGTLPLSKGAYLLQVLAAAAAYNTVLTPSPVVAGEESVMAVRRILERAAEANMQPSASSLVHELQPAQGAVLLLGLACGGVPESRLQLQHALAMLRYSPEKLSLRAIANLAAACAASTEGSKAASMTLSGTARTHLSTADAAEGSKAACMKDSSAVTSVYEGSSDLHEHPLTQLGSRGAMQLSQSHDAEEGGRAGQHADENTLELALPPPKPSNQHQAAHRQDPEQISDAGHSSQEALARVKALSAAASIRLPLEPLELNWLQEASQAVSTRWIHAASKGSPGPDFSVVYAVQLLQAYMQLGLTNKHLFCAAEGLFMLTRTSFIKPSERAAFAEVLVLMQRLLQGEMP